MIDPRPISEFKFTQEEYDRYQAGEEIWRDIEGWEGMYSISTHGRVRSNSRIARPDFNPVYLKERILKPFVNQYYFVKIQCNGKIETIRIHRHQGILFLNNPENKKEVNHIDGVKLNIHLSNLEWNTKSENMKHAFRTGLIKKTLNGKIGKDSLRRKIVHQYTKQMEYVKSFYGCYEAQRATGCKNTSISACALGKLKSAGGFIWSYTKF